MTRPPRTPRAADAAADAAAERYAKAPRGQRLYRLTLAQHARLHALRVGNKAARRGA